MNRQPDISIVIVSYNTQKLTLACIGSIYEHARALSFEIIVVDNASTDGSVEAIADRFPETRVIRNHNNRGFGAANNQGMATAQGHYLLLLNSDTLITQHSLEKLLDYAQRHPNIGAVGCAVRGLDGRRQETIFRSFTLSYCLINIFVPSRLMRRSRLLGSPWYVGADPTKLKVVDVISGCCMLLPKYIYLQTRGFDESFFMYSEEYEWCNRINKLGKRVIYFPDATITHIGGQSTKLLPEHMYLEMSRSQVRYFYKTRGPFNAYLANLFMMLRDLPKAAAWLLLSCWPGPATPPRCTTLRLIALRFVMHFKGLFKPIWANASPLQTTHKAHN